MQPLKVLSLFDGLSGTQIALDKLGIPVQKYVAAEVDKYAIKVAQANFPDTIQVGDVKQYKVTEHFDLITFGSPCQGFSFAGAGLNFQDPRSQLFFEAVRILNEAKAINPDITFLMENVRMKKESEHIISDYLGVEPVAINSNIFSAQSRYRLYWTNLNVGELPQDKGIVLKDILEDEVDPKYFAGDNLLKNYRGGNQLNPDYKSQANTIHDTEKKGPTICAGTHGYALGYVPYEQTPQYVAGAWRGRYYKDGVKQDQFGSVASKTKQMLELRKDEKTNTVTTVQKDNVLTKDGGYTWRKLTCLECERLQTVPDNYTNHVSNSQRYKMLGNGYNIDTVAFVLSSLHNIKKMEQRNEFMWRNRKH